MPITVSTLGILMILNVSHVDAQGVQLIINKYTII